MFDELKKEWQNQSTNKLPEINEILGAINKDRNSMRRNLIFGVVALLATVVVGLIIWLTFSFEYLTTKIAFIMLGLSILAATGYLLYLSMQLPKEIDASKPSNRFVNDWVDYKAKSQRYASTFMNIYVLMITVGMALYLYEVTEGNSTLRMVAYCSTGAWILFFTFYMRPNIERKTQAKIQRMIEDFDKIKDQF